MQHLLNGLVLHALQRHQHTAQVGFKGALVHTGLGAGLRGEVAALLRDDYVSVFVPTTPNPTGGYFVLVRRSECIELEMSVDAALKYIVSMGVVAPPDLAAIEESKQTTLSHP